MPARIRRAHDGRDRPVARTRAGRASGARRGVRDLRGARGRGAGHRRGGRSHAPAHPRSAERRHHLVARAAARPAGSRARRGSAHDGGPYAGARGHLRRGGRHLRRQCPVVPGRPAQSGRFDPRRRGQHRVADDSSADRRVGPLDHLGHHAPHRRSRARRCGGDSRVGDERRQLTGTSGTGTWNELTLTIWFVSPHTIPPVWRSAARLLGRIDERLNNVSFSTKAGLTALTIFLIAVGAVRHFPAGREPGTDTIVDNYEARVVRNDVRDMYTKRLVGQTPLEAATWSKEASSPYPPATLLVLAGLAAVGDAVGIGLAGMVAAVAMVFLTLSLIYFLRTRWYLFPLLYLNFGYLAERFFFVQDGSYLVMLVVVMTALLLVARRPAAGALLMAVATTMKLSPLYYARHLGTSWMPRWVAPALVAVVDAGRVPPHVV